MSEKEITNSSVVNMKDLIFEFYEQIESYYNSKSCIHGLATGFYDFDMFTGGLHKSELTVLASRHSMGKTSLAVNLMCNLILKESTPVCFVTYEMSRNILASRIISSVAEIEAKRIFTGHLSTKGWEILAESLKLLSEKADAGLFNVISGCKLNYLELFDEIRFFALNNPNGVIIVDYFQLIKLIGEKDRIIELSELAVAFKRLAIELDIPIILLSQVAKKCEDKSDKRPLLTDLAECDALAQHADNVIFIYRDDYYYEINENYKPVNKGESELIVAKQKNGPIGTLKLIFEENIFKFKNIIKVED